MKNIQLALLGVLLALNARSQYVDDFEGYVLGSYLAVSSPYWSTWNNSPGSAEDVLITGSDAHSGNQSIYFSSTAPTGGPQDVILPFGGPHVSGNFLFEMWVKVESNKGAYFNFQSDVAVGQTWALECFFTNTGAMEVISDATTVISGAYPANTWFKVTWDIDLSLNNWQMLIDGIPMGSFSNTNNRIASMDIFPVNNRPGANNISGYYVDDVAYTHTPTTLPNLNAATVTVKHGMKLVGQVVHPVVTIRNLGMTTITSFKIDVTYNGATVTENVSGVSIPSLAVHDVNLAQTLTAASGNKDITATVSQVNGGGADGNPSDDSKTISINPIVPAPGKMVLAEEATGTWCGWCPRGTVAMANMQEAYPQFWAGVAVHNADPMVNTDYDGAFGATGFPNAKVDRSNFIDPSGIENAFLTRIQQAPKATLVNSATYDAGNRKLKVHLDVTFQGAASGDWRVALVLTEHGVTGSGSNWGQANYYSYQSQNMPLVGAGKNWQQELNPVPGGQMVYDHVARLITPSFGGMTGAFPSSISANDKFGFDFEVALDASWEKDEIEIITMLIAPGGQIDNAAKMSAAYAYPVGVEGVEPSLFTLHPNPASDVIILTLSESSQPEITITDMLGRITYVVKPTFEDGQVTIPVGELASGMYLVHVRNGNSVSAVPVVVGR